MIRKIILFIVILVALLAIGSYIVLNLSGASTAGKTVDYTLPATELFTAFDSNENSANKKYIGKIIQVTGKIISTEKDGNDATVVLLDSGNGMDAIMCTLTKGEENKLKKGSKTISIRGICAGKTMDVVINKGLIVE